jgi:aspartate 1-decarboxylase
MLIQVVKSKIHRVRVTQAELNYIGRNQRLSVTFYQTVSRHGNGGMQKIDEEDF